MAVTPHSPTSQLHAPPDTPWCRRCRKKKNQTVWTGLECTSRDRSLPVHTHGRPQDTPRSPIKFCVAFSGQSQPQQHARRLRRFPGESFPVVTISSSSHLLLRRVSYPLSRLMRQRRLLLNTPASQDHHSLLSKHSMALFLC